GGGIAPVRRIGETGVFARGAGSRPASVASGSLVSSAGSTCATLFGMTSALTLHQFFFDPGVVRRVELAARGRLAEVLVLTRGAQHDVLRGDVHSVAVRVADGAERRVEDDVADAAAR